jgi:predicted aconitase
MMWKDAGARPELAFVGCPHLSRAQLYGWLGRLEGAAKAAGTSRLRIPTLLTTAPGVEEAFRKDASAVGRLEALGARLSSICPLMYMNNPLCRGKAVITCSNKLRTYTGARYFTEAELAEIVARGTL